MLFSFITCPNFCKFFFLFLKKKRVLWLFSPRPIYKILGKDQSTTRTTKAKAQGQSHPMLFAANKNTKSFIVRRRASSCVMHWTSNHQLKHDITTGNEAVCISINYIKWGLKWQYRYCLEQLTAKLQVATACYCNTETCPVNVIKRQHRLITHMHKNTHTSILDCSSFLD